MAVPKKPMGKKKPAAKADVQTLSSSDFKKLFKGKSKVWDRSKKKEPTAGYVKAEEVIKGFGLRPGKGVTAKARLTSAKVVRIGDMDPIAKFNYVVTEGPNKGMPLQADIWLNIEDDEKLEKALDSISFLLQKLGYEVDELGIENLAEVLEELTKEKPYCIIYLSMYVGKSGKNKGVANYNVRINAAYEPDDGSDEADDDEASEDDEEEDDEAGEDEDDSESDSEDGEGEEDEESEDDSEVEYEEESDEEEEEEGPDEDDPATWIGYSVKAKVKGKSVTAEVVKYNKKTKVITIKSGKTTHEIKKEAVTDWA